MTSAIERLRELLDERGVEWYEPTMKPNTTWFPDAYGIDCRVKPWGDALCVKRYDLTPEQAVEATLGDADATGERQRDAVEVVRCSDCKRFAVDQSDHDYRTGWWCKRWYTDMVEPDGFCAWGEKRED